MKVLKNLLKQFGEVGNKKYYRHSKKETQKKEALIFVDMIQKWDKIIGKNFAKFTIPLRIQDSCLIILSSHPALSEQLKAMQWSIKKKIDKAYPELQKEFNRLGFKTNPEIFKNHLSSQKKSPVEKKSQSLHPQSPEYKRLKSAASKIGSDIEDEELRSSFESLVIQSLKDQDLNP